MYVGTQADRCPERIAMVMENGSGATTYAELDAASNRLAHAYAGLGLQRGDVTAVMLENSVTWAHAWWAAVRSGRYITPINWHLAPDEVEYILANSEAKVLLTGPATRDAAAAAVRNLPDITVIQVDAGPGADARVVDYADFVGDQPSHRIAREYAGAPMFYSSGTTGRPKGIKAKLLDLPPSEVATIAYTMVTSFGMRDGDRYLNTAPLYHGAPASFTFGAQCIGATPVIMHRFDARRALQRLQDEKITYSQWVPAMFQRMLRLPEEVKAAYDVSGLRVAVHAAAPCPVEVKRAMIDWWGPILLEYYGATEAGATFITSEEWLERPGSVGRTWSPSTTMVILDVDTKEPLGPGEEGLVYFNNLAAHQIEYYKDPEKTAGIYHNGLATASDVGYVDDDGYLYLTDRLSNMIISGGVNIYPQEIEECLGNHPAVQDVAVFGVPNEEFGEEVKAVVQLMPGETSGDDVVARLTEHCRANIAGFKLPRSFDFVDSLPREENGKLYKRRLRDPYWAGRTSKIV